MDRNLERAKKHLKTISEATEGITFRLVPIEEFEKEELLKIIDIFINIYESRLDNIKKLVNLQGNVIKSKLF